MEFIKRLDLFDWLATVLTFLFVLSGSIVSIGRFWQYETFYYDFGIFDRAIWEVAHFKTPIIDHLVLSGKLIFADHFSPGIFLFSPLYWFTNHSEVIFIAQALAVGISGFVIYLIGIEVLKSKFASFAILLSYFLFVGLQNAVISDFHEVTIATLPLSLVFLSIIKKNLKLYIATFLLTMLFKESLFILGIALGIFIILFNRRWLKVGIATILFSIFWGILTIKFIIPHFSQGSYAYGESISLNPFHFVEILFNTKLKQQTILYSFQSFGFLPLLSPAFWILILQDLITRFYSGLGATRTTLGLHYSAVLSVIMAVSSFYGLKNLKKFISKKVFGYVLILIILNSIFLYRFVLHGPFALSYNGDFYKHTNDFSFLNNLLIQVPSNASVMTQNNIASHFTHNKNIYLLRMNYDNFNADYIVVDDRPGQNSNDFFTEANFNVNKFLAKIKEDKNYKIIYKTDYQYIFKKI